MTRTLFGLSIDVLLAASPGWLKGHVGSGMLANRHGWVKEILD